MWIWVWLVVAIVATIGEMLTTGLFLAPFAVAAVITGVISILLPFLGLQVAIFAGLSLAGIIFFRPLALHTLGWDVSEPVIGPVSQHYLANKRAVVTQTVDASSGQVRVGQGEFWSARSFDPDDRFEPGTPVEVVLVDGVTALVGPVPEPELEATMTEKGQ